MSAQIEAMTESDHRWYANYYGALRQQHKQAIASAKTRQRHAEHDYAIADAAWREHHTLAAEAVRIRKETRK